MKNSKNNKWRERFFRYAPLFLWICVIFAASSKMGAMSNTSLIIRPILNWLFPNTPDEIITLYHSYIRKLAHFTEYAVLAFWALRAFSGSAIFFLKRHHYSFAFVLVLLTASIDEYYQSFNPVRTGSIYDVFIDCLGGLVIIALYIIFKILKKSSVRRPPIAGTLL